MSDAAALPLTLCLFGPFEVRVNGAPIPRLRARKGQWLLALLALRHGSEVERDWLAGTLWPDSPEPQAFNSLRVSLADLRRALGSEAGRIGSPTPHTLSLDLSNATVDLIVFDAAMARGGTAATQLRCVPGEVVLAGLEQAVALYRGPLLEGCAEAWAFQERQAREQAYLQALETLAIHALAGRNAAAAERYLRRAVAVDPLRETAQRALMQALADQGSYAAALLAYRALRLLLHRELNAEPDPETKALFQQLRTEARQKAAPGARCPVGMGARCLARELPAPLPGTGHGSAATLTFLFTDMEGSVQRWEHSPEAMPDALARHDALLRHAIETHGGHVFKTVGDQFCAAFATASDALEAALEGQRALQAGPWGEEGPIRVRMALHTGAAEERDGDYLGPTLNRVARLVEAGHGGQILLSRATQELAQDPLPEGASLHDLGAHRLKDLQRPEQVFQLVHPDLPAEFPPLRSLEALAHNLPVQLTRFIGREREMAEVKRLLPSTHLLTLTGVGGCGKTRLALQLAADLLDGYLDGVWLVELAALADPALVPRAVAAALGVREQPNRPLTETLADSLRSRSLLLVLDNCEHMLAACAHLAEALLRACPNLRLLATSREALGIAGETRWSVPPLSVPDLRQPSAIEMLTQYEAVRLFVDRATAVLPAFTVSDQNAATVAQVCRRLDGLPLAIELAAARVRVLTVEQIAQHLDDRFRLLTGGSRTALPRQQTLRALMDWSFDLLSEEEQVLLRRLSVFAGGWTLEAAEAVCGDAVLGARCSVLGGTATGPSTEHRAPSTEFLDLLTQLVDKSLVLAEEQRGVARYRFLETVRQYSRERLIETGEAEAVRSLHMGFFLRLAEEAEPNLAGPDRRTWLARLDLEHDNLRAALGWSGASGGETALRLAGALGWFWSLRGHLHEGRGWLEEALTGGHRAERVPERTAARAKALWAAGNLGWVQGDYNAARSQLEESVTIWGDVGDQRWLGRSLYMLASVLMGLGDPIMARSLYEESVALFRAAASKGDLALSLGLMGYMVHTQADDAAARALFAESEALFRELGDEWGLSIPLVGLALIAGGKGDHATAWSLLEEALAIYRAEGDKWSIGQTLNLLGEVAQRQGELERATEFFTESLALHRDVGAKGDIPVLLHNLGRQAQLQLEHRRAARLFAAAAALREAIIGTAPLSLTDRADGERDIAAVRTTLGEKAFAAAWAEGRAMTLEQALAYASAATDPG